MGVLFVVGAVPRVLGPFLFVATCLQDLKSNIHKEFVNESMSNEDECFIMGDEQIISNRGRNKHDRQCECWSSLSDLTSLFVH